MAGYAELHVRSHFSFLKAASSPRELVARAQELSLSALALTDWNGVYGIVELREGLLELAPKHPLRLVYGSELTCGDDVFVALACSREGYANLCLAITRGRFQAPKGQFQLSVDDFLMHASGLLVLGAGPRSAPMKDLRQGRSVEAGRALGRFKEALGDRFFVELVRHREPGSVERSKAMAALAQSLRIDTVATNDVVMHSGARKRLFDVLRCMEEGVTLAESGLRVAANAQAHLKTCAQMEALFPDALEAVHRSVDIAARVDFDLRQVRYHYPTSELPAHETHASHLARLAEEGLVQRLGERAEAHRAQLRKELSLISELEYEGYFLSLRDIIEFCWQRGILCQGRGSAANSVVCFALGITSVSPDTIDMLFERFISRERHEPPDIDVDIEHDRREEVLQYVYEKYGRERAAMVAEVVRFRRKSAVHDVGKVLGFGEEQLARLSPYLSRVWDGIGPEALAAAGIAPEGPSWRALMEVCEELEGFPRHVSIHVGGFVLSQEPIHRVVPMENARMEGRTVIQWAKDDVEAMGMFKVDLLGLGMLTVLSKAFALVQRHRGLTLALHSVPHDDAATYALLQDADTVGVFQVESRAQMNMLPRLKPKCFYDLIIEVALVRPGPIQGHMVHPYLRRRRGEEPIDFPHPRLEAILQKTCGVPLFQEQVMRLAVAVGGYTPGEADQLRRDMASWRSEGRVEGHRKKLMDGMRLHGLTEEFAQRVFAQILGFGSYGFPESHAAAFAQLAYVSAYLKCHYPAEFACALLNAQPMGFYSPAVIVSEVKRRGVGILPVDVQHSTWDSSIAQGNLRLGLRLVRGLGEDAGRSIERERAQGPFVSQGDFVRRVTLPKAVMMPLAAAGAFRSLLERRASLWSMSATAQTLGALWSDDEGGAVPKELSPLSEREEMAFDLTYASAFPREHPMEWVRDTLKAQGVLPARRLGAVERGAVVWVAGLVITRQMPDAKGFLFLTLEDETGFVDIAVAPAKLTQFREVIMACKALRVRGRMVKDGAARNLAFIEAKALTLSETPLPVAARNFH